MFGMNTNPGVETLTAIELKQQFDRGVPFVVLDVREEGERAICVIPLPPTARDLHIAMDEVADRLDDLRAAVGTDPLVVYCHHGVRSWSVALWLAGQGIREVFNLTGGIDAWSTSVDPKVSRY